MFTWIERFFSFLLPTVQTSAFPKWLFPPLLDFMETAGSHQRVPVISAPAPNTVTSPDPGCSASWSHKVGDDSLSDFITAHILFSAPPFSML